jgi:hypothetical protein
MKEWGGGGDKAGNSTKVSFVWYASASKLDLFQEKRFAMKTN